MLNRIAGPLVAGLLLAAAVLLLLPGASAGPRQTTTVRPFVPTPASRPLYGIAPPGANPDRQRHIVRAGDGTDLFVETWLPASKGRHTPPAALPTILVMTPYTGLSEKAGSFVDYFVQRGFAVAQHHVRGTGNSGGCLEQTGRWQIDDGSRVVEYLGRDAPWSNGAVGMYGVSYDAETQLSVAALGDPARTRWLKAIIPIASVGGQYEYSYMDGVPFAGQAPTSMAAYLAISALPAQSVATQPHAPQHAPEKTTCQPEMFVNSLDTSGDLTSFWKEREYRRGATSIRAATLLVHGLADFNVKPLTAAGLFERIPDSTPHTGLFGIWEHAAPDNHSVARSWERVDWMPMATAWFDRFLKGLDTGVEDWPEVQVQGTDGRWRAEPDWPFTGGPAGQLALGADGRLGVRHPAGSTGYVEATPRTGRATDPVGTYAVFESGPLPGRLEITGQPVLDLWVTLGAPDAHIAAMIETFDRSGTPIEAGENYGFRSARHLAPLVQNRFAQKRGETPPVGEPIRIPVRFYPTDLVVPAGGTIRLTIAGSIPFAALASAPSGTGATVTIHHDCDHPSALRFLTPTDRPDLLNVRERFEPKRGLGRTRTVRAPTMDGGGLARTAVCGEAPIRMSSFGPPLAAPLPTSDVLGRSDLPATGVPGSTWLGAAVLASAAAFSTVMTPNEAGDRKRPLRR